MLVEHRDRQPREVGVAHDDLLAGRRPGRHGVDGRRERGREARAEARLVGAERLGDPGPARQQVGDQRKVAAAHARDAHGRAVMGHERRGEPGGGVELVRDLDQAPVGREAAEPRPQRLRLSRQRRAPRSGRARRRRRGRARSTRQRPRSRSARVPGGARSPCPRRAASSRARRSPAPR